jgi:ribosomal protein S18 acetylase RimI-like enzyme
MSFEIRKFIPSDKSAWEALYRGYLEFYETAFESEAIDLTWARIMSGEIQAFAAVEKDDLLGFTHFHFQISTWTKTHTCYLEDLFVAAEARSRGIARSLIAEVENITRESGGTEIFWITRKSNERAQALYNQVAELSDFLMYQKKFTDK